MDIPDYGLWPVVAIDSLTFILFAYAFARPRTGRDWRSFGVFSGFIVALFTEMYGFPLTIFLLSGWLSSRYPDLDLFTHDNGHLWQTLLGWKGDPHLNAVHLLSGIIILAGFGLLATAWGVLFAAQRRRQLATTGPYHYIRHPQYVGFSLIMLGFLVQWPTLLTAIMFGVLVVMYMRLARQEEREVAAEFGDEYRAYVQSRPGFLPRPK